MKIIPLSEGAFSIDKTKVFVPFDKEKDDLQKRSQGSLLVEIQPFVIITDNDVLLLDTGLGFAQEDGVLQIHHNLIEAGINPMEVTKVLVSHLHKDHSGGVFTKDDVQGRQFLSFPNATYYVNRKELDSALQTGAPSYVVEDFAEMASNGSVEFLEGNGEIEGYIKYEETGAHTPHHQVFWIEDGGQTAFFGADVAPQLKQMKTKFVAKYDHDGQKCMELRQKWWEAGQMEGWTFLFYHDIATPLYRHK